MKMSFPVKLNEDWENFPNNLRLVTKEGWRRPYRCTICMANLVEPIKNEEDERWDSKYYGPKTKSWYCTEHWQENWKQELEIEE